MTHPEYPYLLSPTKYYGNSIRYALKKWSCVSYTCCAPWRSNRVFQTYFYRAQKNTKVRGSKYSTRGSLLYKRFRYFYEPFRTLQIVAGIPIISRLYVDPYDITLISSSSLFLQTTPRPRPSLSSVHEARVHIFHPPQFGATLDELMTMQVIKLILLLNIDALWTK